MSRVDLKVVLLGKEFGGKTSLVERFLHDRFQGSIPYQNTIGAAYGAKRLYINGRNLTMGIWDTAGSERYEAMSRIYYRGASAAIVCYDLTDVTSFERAQFWIKELKKNEENCRIYLCGTKKDLLSEGLHQRKVDVHNVNDYAEEINARVFETSSKTGEKVSELFNSIAEDYIQNPLHTDVQASLSLEEQHSTKPTRSCCFIGK